MAHRVGIDAGSKTLKVVVLNDDDTIAFSIYLRHRFDIATRLAQTIHDVCWRFGDIDCTVAITGSAGIEVAQWLELPFVQEVIATTKAVQTMIPDADAVIELGGEDAKIIYLTGGLEQRMNATCAGGTGGFIDTIAFMLGIHTKEFSQLSMGASHIYPIASRCAVFAQTDVRPLLNAGANKADIAASALEAVIRQTLGGLACGRPIRGKIVYLGGPCEFIPDLVRRFNMALKLERNMGIKPKDAHLFTAQGAALYGGELPGAPIVRLSDLEARLLEQNQPEDDLPRLRPLFTTQAELDEFKARHAETAVSTSHVTSYEGSLYVGMDAGSTAIKLACVSEDGRLIYSDNEPTEGDVLETSRKMLKTMYRNLPHSYSGDEFYTIEHATVTGYGEDLLKAALGFDSGVVETVAHTNAALHFEPKASFVLDIGGQDMKAIWIKNGMVQETVLNEACSSGCGAFIEGTAYSLRSTPSKFSEVALKAAAPIDLGTKCTVFMTSRVRHAQKIGASMSDIAAGIAYSVVQNALFRIIGMSNIDSMGDHIVVQGGTFMSDAVLRAFELISGKEVIRPGCAHLMGALGAALVARNRAKSANSESGKGKPSSKGASHLLTAQEIDRIKLKRTSSTCPGCPNSCAVTIIDFGNGRTYVSGNRCERAYQYFDIKKDDDAKKETPPNAIALKQKLLKRYTTVLHEEQPENGTGPAMRIGIMNTLNTTDQLPFWHTLLSKLGLDVVVVHSSPEDAATRNRTGLETIPSESVCFPAKLSHSRLFALLEAGATHILMPKYIRGRRCPVRCEYVDALLDGISAFDIEQPSFIIPELEMMTMLEAEGSPEDRESIFSCLAPLFSESAPLSREAFQTALEDAWEEQRNFHAMVKKGNDRALTWSKQPGNHGAILVGRPYHIDPVLLHEIDDMLQSLGFSVVSPLEMNLPELDGKPEFHAAKPALRVAKFIQNRPNLHMVCLESFGCTYDALSLPELQQVLNETGQFFTGLKIDEIADMAHIRIRLRTLAETIFLSESNKPIDVSEDIGTHMFGKPKNEFTKHEFIKRDDVAPVAPAAKKVDGKPSARPAPAPLNYPNRNNFIAPNSLGSSAPPAQRAWGTPYMPKEAFAAIEEAAKKYAPPELADKAPEVTLEPAGKKVPPMPRSFIEKLKSGMLR
ncbi:MAG: acyl-CoA dehydratase activase [Eggerthellaceae bacterium]|nr:acyl-CoA dehydratase activase [Eggerthellaceae bacterium]